MVLAVQNLPASAGDIGEVGSVPGSGRSPGGRHGNPLHIFAWRIPQLKSLAGYSPWGHKRDGHDLATKTTKKGHRYLFSFMEK